jgi:hypothetical protein
MCAPLVRRRDYAKLSPNAVVPNSNEVSDLRGSGLVQPRLSRGVQFFRLLSDARPANLPGMDPSAPSQTIASSGEILPPDPRLAAAPAGLPALTSSGQATLEAAQVLAKKATAPATLPACNADWTHFAPMVRRARLCASPGGAGNRWRLPRQPGRNPRPHHHPPRAVGPGEDASVQRSAVELGASRHPGPAAGRVADAWPMTTAISQ